MFTAKDLEQLNAHGVTPEKVEQEIRNFKNGFPFLPISRPAAKGDGIISVRADECKGLVSDFDAKAKGLDIIKFVPASGAATRMFKALYEFVNEDKQNKGVDKILANIKSMALYAELSKYITHVSSSKDIINAIISTPGLNYGNLPKGLLLFHKYETECRTPVEEHLVEGARYGSGRDNVSNIHFTISKEHSEFFKTLVSKVLPKYEKRLGIKYNISYSEQQSSTDTIAVTPDNNLFRNSDGSLLLRPAGHGALIENLNNLSADIIFIKTIDNVSHADYAEDTTLYKKLLASLLLKYQADIFLLLRELDLFHDAGTVSKCVEFIKSGVGFTLPNSFETEDIASQCNILKKLLNRPIRVAGMVKNEGEPGGGPFWVRAKDGSESLQIAESSQISPSQISLMKTATHFNPVDLVCGVKDYKGAKFNLKNYVDPSTGFISSKSKDGRELKAQELPGLWNGAMADWVTLFVEVPISTFNPVKEAVDLLRPQHNPKSSFPEYF